MLFQNYGAIVYSGKQQVFCQVPGQDLTFGRSESTMGQGAVYSIQIDPVYDTMQFPIGNTQKERKMKTPAKKTYHPFFQVQPLPKPTYKKYKDICGTLKISSHEATALAFETLYDAVHGDYDNIKQRFSGQYQYTPPAQSSPTPTFSWPSRDPDFNLPVRPDLPPFLDEDHRIGFIETIIGDSTKTYRYRVNADQSTDVWVNP